MYYTITFNPAIDLVMGVEDLKLGHLNRAVQEAYVVGGKGINISHILTQFQLENTATGFLGGFTGEYIKDSLQEAGILTHFIEVDGTTRINVKLKAAEETEINGSGPTVTEDKFQAFISYLEESIQVGDTVFLAGNAAPGLDHRHYQAVAKLCLDKKVKFVLDTNRDLLTETLPYRPFLIKPNRDELAEITGMSLKSLQDIIQAVEELQEQGARNVIVSLGGDGALLVTEEGEVYQADTPPGKLVNSVGAGDSMVAGFTSHFNETDNYAQSLQMGSACGSGTAYSVGIANRAKIEELYPLIHIDKIR